MIEPSTVLALGFLISSFETTVWGTEKVGCLILDTRNYVAQQIIWKYSGSDLVLLKMLGKQTLLKWFKLMIRNVVYLECARSLGAILFE